MRLSHQHHKGKPRFHIQDPRIPGHKLRERLCIPVIDMLGMIAQTDKVPPPDEIGKLEPWFVRHGQKHLPGRQGDKPFKGGFRFEEMFEHFQSHDEIEATAIIGR